MMSAPAGAIARHNSHSVHSSNSSQYSHSMSKPNALPLVCNAFRDKYNDTTSTRVPTQHYAQPLLNDATQRAKKYQCLCNGVSIAHRHHLPWCGSDDGIATNPA